MRQLLFLLAITLLASCRDEPKALVVDDRNPSIDAQIKKDKEQQASNEKRIAELGGVTLVKLDNQTKCNLYKGYYLLNKPVTDSASLAFLAKYYADDLFYSNKKDASCPFPLMTTTSLYMNNEDLKIGYSLASCSITPSNYQGDVYVDSYNVAKYKKTGHAK